VRSFGSLSVSAGTAVSAQASTLGSVNSRRHLPTWITSGISLPTGAFSSTKCPELSVMAEAIGLPLTSHAQVAPVLSGSSAAFGT
jgi:hypothetical protein